MSTSNVIGANEAIPVPDLAGASFGEPACEWTFVFVWLFTFAIYARPEDILPSLGELHLTFALGLCAGLAYFLALGSGGTRISWSPQLQIVSLLTIWFFVGVPFAYWKGGSLHQLVHPWLKTFFIFFLLTQVLVTADRIQKLLWAIILSELLVTAYSIVESSKVMWVGDRMLGVSLGILGWNFLGIAAASTIPYMAALFVLRKSFLRTTLLIATVCSLMWMLVLTASRGGILNVLVSIALSFLLVLRGSARGKMVGVATVLALMVSVSLAPTVFWERVGTLWNSSELQANMTAASARESTEDRLVALKQAVEYTLEHPIFGLGIGNFGIASGIDVGQSTAWRSTHNTYAEICSEAGVPALLLFIGLIITTLRNLTKIIRTIAAKDAELDLMARATLVSVLSFSFGAIFAHLTYEYYLYYLIAIAVGLQQRARASVELATTDWIPEYNANSSLPKMV